jgi:cytochrome c-type biogenesis protein
VCVAAGLVLFASPCCLPLVPGYLSYLAAVGGGHRPAVPVGEPVRGAVAGRWRVTVAAGLFVAGFTVVFVAATASVFGLIGALAVSRVLLQRIGASSRSSWGWRSWG